MSLFWDGETVLMIVSIEQESVQKEAAQPHPNQTQMSDQTDIERIAEKHLEPYVGARKVAQRDLLIPALTELSALRDEETARLKEEVAKVNEFREKACAKHREVRDQRDQYHSASLQLAESVKDLQARLAEAETKISLIEEEIKHLPVHWEFELNKWIAESAKLKRE